jgi:thioredoxin reductase (NADPH)
LSLELPEPKAQSLETRALSLEPKPTACRPKPVTIKISQRHLKPREAALPTKQIPDTLPKPQLEARAGMRADAIVIGAGPTGLACAIESQRAGFKVISIDKGCLVNSLFNYPANMIFFTTPELLEIGDIPFSSANPKPNRLEALEYYRKVTEHYQLDVRQYQRVETVAGADNDFHITTCDRLGRVYDYSCHKVIVATGYYDRANLLHVPGEDLPKVMHYYREPHPYFDNDVLVIGGKNSAAISALDLWRHGARVTLVHRGPKMHAHVKYWILPDIENRIKNGEIQAYFNTTVQEIAANHVVLETPDGELTLKNDFVFALTGYHPDYEFLRSMGIELSSEQCRPVCDPVTLESNVPGIYVAGVIVAGSRTNEIFIENGRFHGQQIAAHLKQIL